MSGVEIKVSLTLEPLPTRTIVELDGEALLKRLVSGEPVNVSCTLDEGKRVNTYARFRGYRFVQKAIKVGTDLVGYQFRVIPWDDGGLVRTPGSPILKKDGTTKAPSTPGRRKRSAPDRSPQ